MTQNGEVARAPIRAARKILFAFNRNPNSVCDSPADRLDIAVLHFRISGSLHIQHITPLSRPSSPDCPGWVTDFYCAHFKAKVGWNV